MNGKNSDLGSDEINARSAIGRRIVYWALAAVTLMGLAAMIIGGVQNNLTYVKDILSMLLPVMAAWVGTVLAFYFSRENYVAAAQNNAAILGLTLQQRLEATPAKSAMIPTAQADLLKTKEAEDKIKLKDHVLEGDAIKKGRNRIPILGDDSVVRYVVHRSMIDKFIAEQAMAGNPVAALTFKDLLNSGDNKEWITSFGCVCPEDNLSKVKTIMESNPKCSDVIVTEDGTRNKPVLGWLTNVIVLDKSRA